MQDAFEYAAKVLVDVDVPEADYGPCLALHKGVATGVVFAFLVRRMRCPIELNHKSSFAAGKIGKVRAYWILPLETVAVELLALQA